MLCQLILVCGCNTVTSLSRPISCSVYSQWSAELQGPAASWEASVLISNSIVRVAQAWDWAAILTFFYQGFIHMQRNCCERGLNYPESHRAAICFNPFVRDSCWGAVCHKLSAIKGKSPADKSQLVGKRLRRAEFSFDCVQGEESGETKLQSLPALFFFLVSITVIMNTAE